MSAPTFGMAPLPPSVHSPITQRQPFLWVNDKWARMEDLCSVSDLSIADVYAADQQLHRFSSLLVKVFPELKASDGIIESELHCASELQRSVGSADHHYGRWFVKGDHALPIAGSIKARGGIYEVLLHAQEVAINAGIMSSGDDPVILGSQRARSLFERRRIIVGSTGNLGMSIGAAASALGFEAVVHVSADAKEWKKARLRTLGANVEEHTGDYGSAVCAAREEALRDSQAYFVDDESSRRLFLGYSVAAIRLQRQLSEQGVIVDAKHPLFVYLPCGVGGAPGGITFGLRHCFGDYVHCFFAEPVASPCMLVRLASGQNASLSVRDLGLDNCTEADGLAVARASELAAQLIQPLVSGIFTVQDGHLFEDLYRLKKSLGLRVEPSGAAGVWGPRWLNESDAGRGYLATHNLLHISSDATHVVWTTGGSLVPDEEYSGFCERGRALCPKQESLGARAHRWCH